MIPKIYHQLDFREGVPKHLWKYSKKYFNMGKLIKFIVVVYLAIVSECGDSGGMVRKSEGSK